MTLRFSTGAGALLVAAGAWIGCGGDASPLGGPYGGTGNNPTPSSENLPLGDDSGSNASSSSGSTGGGSGAGNPGGSGSGSGGGSSSSGVVGSNSSSGSGHNNSSGSSGGNGTTSSSSSSGSNSTSSSGSGTSSSSGGPTAMTWTAVYNKYLASGTTGNCASGFCHGNIGSPSSCYSWLQSKGQINGTSTPALTSSRSSVVSWYGGNMPPSGPSASQSAQAIADMNAWAAAGGQNN